MLNKLLKGGARAVLHVQWLLSGSMHLLVVAANAGLQMHLLLRATKSVFTKDFKLSV